MNLALNPTLALTLALSAAPASKLPHTQGDEDRITLLEGARIEAFGDTTTRFVTDAKETFLIGLAAEGMLVCVELKSGETRWKTDVSGGGQKGIEASYDISLGDDLVAVSLGIGAVNWLDVKTGAQREIHGAPAFGAAVSVVTDPKDRWTWLGFLEGGVARLNPENINDYSRRGVEGGGVHSLAQDASAGVIAMGCADGGIRFLNPKSATVDKKKLLPTGDEPVTALCFVDKATTLATGSKGGRVHVWKVANGRAIAAIEGHSQAITALAADSKGLRLAVGDASGLAAVYDAGSGELLARLHAPNDQPVGDLDFLDKGERVAGALHRGGVLVWDLSGL